MNGSSGGWRHDAFISYSSEDEAWVHRLVDDLKAADLDIFFAPLSLRPGRLWMPELEAGISSSFAGVVVLSPAALASPMVRFEFSLMFAKYLREGRPVVPVYYRDADDLGFLGGIQWIDFRGLSGPAYTDAVQRLVAAIRGVPDDRPDPSRCRRVPEVPLGCLLLLLLLIALVGAGALWFRSNTFARLRATQRAVQALDERVTALGSRAAFWSDGAEEGLYLDPATKERIATDRRLGGVLQWRDFYHDHRLVARDSFVYRNGIAVEKVREYFDGQQRVFLIDRFAQDGLLLRKRHCPRGPEAMCRIYVDVMRSPLPPMFPLVYR